MTFDVKEVRAFNQRTRELAREINESGYENMSLEEIRAERKRLNLKMLENARKITLLEDELAENLIAQDHHYV